MCVDVGAGAMAERRSPLAGRAAAPAAPRIGLHECALFADSSHKSSRHAAAFMCLTHLTRYSCDLLTTNLNIFSQAFTKRYDCIYGGFMFI